MDYKLYIFVGINLNLNKLICNMVNRTAGNISGEY